MRQFATILVLALLSKTPEVHGQKLHTFTFTPNDTTVPTFTPLELGDWYQVKVTGVNLNLYKVELNTEEIFRSEPLAFPTFGGISMDGLEQILAGLSAEEAAQVTTNMLAANDGVSKMSDEYVKALATAKSALEGLLPKVRTLDTEVKEWYFDAQLARLAYLCRSKTGAACSTLTNSAGASKRDLGSLLTQRTTLHKKAADLTTEVVGIEGAYAKATTTASVKPILDQSIFAKMHVEMKGALSDARKGVQDLNSALADEKAGTTLAALLDLDNAAGLDFISIPLRYDGGDVLLELDVTPIEPKSHLPAYSTGEMRWPTKVTPYFGVGPSFYVSDLYDQVVSIKKMTTGDSASYTLFNEPRSDKEFGAALKFMGGIQFRGKCSDWGIHASIGPGLSITDPIKPRLLYGLGLSYGRQHRILLDVGGIYGPVARRTRAYSADGEYTEEPKDMTTNRVLGGAHLSLGYVFMLRPARKSDKPQDVGKAEKQKETEEKPKTGTKDQDRSTTAE